MTMNIFVQNELNLAMVDAINAAAAVAPDRIEFVNMLRTWIHHEISPFKNEPVDLVLWLPSGDVEPNDYNPNSVARTEMKLLHTSIDHDGYTQPVVSVRDTEREKSVIVDGFHRYFVGTNFVDIAIKVQGHLPVVHIEKDINDRMASTVRHNRARGKHSVDGMANMVYEMLDNGWTDEGICNELGMEPEELLRLKHITGFSKLFEDVEYKQSWVTKNQILIEKQEREKNDK